MLENIDFEIQSLTGERQIRNNSKTVLKKVTRKKF